MKHLKTFEGLFDIFRNKLIRQIESYFDKEEKLKYLKTLKKLDNLIKLESSKGITDFDDFSFIDKGVAFSYKKEYENSYHTYLKDDIEEISSMINTMNIKIPNLDKILDFYKKASELDYHVYDDE